MLEQILSHDVTLAGSICKLLLSLFLGALIGLERKHKGQKAGMRTFALISMGATLAMLVSIYIPQEYLGLKNGDPGRIAAQVVSGIGFLGAGAIIQSKGSVRGLTTAAGIWITAMIGLAVGAGMYLISVIATLFIVAILILLDRYEHKLHLAWESKIIRLKIKDLVDDLTPYKEVFESHGIHLTDSYLRYDYTQPVSVINFMIRTNNTIDYPKLFDQISAMNPNTSSITLTDEVNQ